MYVQNSLAQGRRSQTFIITSLRRILLPSALYKSPLFSCRLFQDVEDTSTRGCDDFIRPKEVSATYGQSVFFSSYFDLPQVEEVSKFTWSKRNKDSGRSQLILRSGIRADRKCGELLNGWDVTCRVDDLSYIDTVDERKFSRESVCFWVNLNGD